MRNANELVFSRKNCHPTLENEISPHPQVCLRMNAANQGVDIVVLTARLASSASVKLMNGNYKSMFNCSFH